MQGMPMPQMPDAAAIADSKTLWMGQIQPTWDETYVASLFEAHGPVTVKIMRYPTTSSGYAFVDFPTHEAAKAALAALNNQRIPGTQWTFKLNWGVGNGKRSFGSPNEFSLFVGDLPTEVTDSVLFDAFAGQFPSCSSAKVVIDAYTGVSKGYGFVRFTDRSQCDAAITSMNGTVIGGRQVRVSQATAPTRRHGSFHNVHNAAMPAMQMPYQYPMQPFSTPGDSRMTGGYRIQPGAHWMGSRAENAPPMLASARTSEESSTSPDYTAVPTTIPIPEPNSSLLSHFPTPTSPENTTVFVGNLDPAVTEAQLHQHFQGYGNIVQVKIPPNRGCGFVKFDSHDSAEKALNSLNGTLLCSQRIRLDWGKASAARHQQAAMMAAAVDPALGYQAYNPYYAWQAPAAYYIRYPQQYMIPQQTMLQTQGTGRFGQDGFIQGVSMMPQVGSSTDVTAPSMDEPPGMGDFAASAGMQAPQMTTGLAWGNGIVQ